MNSTQASPHAFHPPWGLLLALLAGIAILLLPAQADLPVAGQRMLAILAFAVILWISESVSYEVSAIMILALMAFLLGSAPSLADPGKLIGTKDALTMGLAGFANSALALVASALFIAAAMTHTGLDKRIALLTLSRVGASTHRVLLGAIVVTILLSFIVPSATARVACVVPIMMGVIAAFGVDKRSAFAGGIMILVAQATSIWNVGIQTSAAQNLLSVGFMQRLLGESVSWMDWLIAGAPWSLAMSAILYWVILRVMPPETERIEGGKETVRKALAELGPMTGCERRLLITSLTLLAFWATEGKLHSFDTASTTLVGLAVLMLPGIGVMGWKDAQARIPWGTVIVFGVGISLGTAVLSTGAGTWLAKLMVTHLGMEGMSPFWVFAVLGLFLVLIHIGFASATALTSAMLPIMIALLMQLGGEVNALGISMLLGFVMSFGFLLPINAPQNMVCIATETFTSRQFLRTGLWLTLVGYLLMLVFAATWWRWLGWI
ncbi:anion transporter [Pseudomonas flavescens]|uniref:Anion transporter n=1 Tax=Phytopseudomonas flavescens TaxID=29435 RepID=A0A1G8MAD7_9GAMM|nr:DASS family sodium-coupled anion symporter [Pseudomonas flavescens]SDI64817.1 anion transporter [Pseudomonas flavescens]